MRTWIISSDRLKLFVASKLCVMLCDVDLYYEWFLSSSTLFINFLFLKPMPLQTYLYQEFCHFNFFNHVFHFRVIFNKSMFLIQAFPAAEAFNHIRFTPLFGRTASSALK